MESIKSRVAGIKGFRDDSFIVQKFVEDLETRKEEIKVSLIQVRKDLDQRKEAQSKSLVEVFEQHNLGISSEKASQLQNFIIDANNEIHKLRSRF